MNSKHYYKVFGLTIRSEISMPELISIDKVENPHIEVVTGPLEGPPDNIKNPVDNFRVQYNQRSFYLDMGQVAKVVLEHEETTKITIDLYQEEHINTMMAWLYGSVLTAALQFNNRFALHASAVDVNGELCLFCGHSGIGKSTLAVQLGLRGYPVFSDDKCVLIWNEEEQKYYAEPSLQIVRLWEDATDKLGDQEIFDNPTPVVNKLNKFQYIVNDDKVIKEPMAISKIHIIMNVPKDQELKKIEITGINKIKALQNQTHRFNYVRGLGKTKVFWEFMDHLVKRVPVYRIRRPLETPIDEFADFIKQEIDPS